MVVANSCEINSHQLSVSIKSEKEKKSKDWKNPGGRIRVIINTGFC